MTPLKKTPKTLHAIGLMSGSSLDGLDLAYCEFTIEDSDSFPVVRAWSMKKFTTASYSTEWTKRLKSATQLSGLDIKQLDADFGKYTGRITTQFIREHNLTPDLIASHGHTVFHYPERGFTLQIGDGAAIANQTSCTTVCDFRSQDIAAGGQGAPLAPLADALLLPQHSFYLNLGGIANITAQTPRGYVAFDVCGANQILNALVAELGLPYDDQGQIARSGQFLPALAKEQNQIAYFSKAYPKSLDNEWVRKNQTTFFLEYPAPVADKLHTACRHIARQIAIHIKHIIANEKLTTSSPSLLVSGGGAYNHFLLECIAEASPSIKIEIPDDQIINCKEAALMALMGCLRILNLPNCLASVTGASRNVCGGAVHWYD